MRLYSTATPPAANPRPSTEAMVNDATTTTVRTFNWSVVPVIASITASTTVEVMNVRTTFATPLQNATGAKPNGVMTCRSSVPHWASLPMSFEMDWYAPTESDHRK